MFCLYFSWFQDTKIVWFSISLAGHSLSGFSMPNKHLNLKISKSEPFCTLIPVQPAVFLILVFTDASICLIPTCNLLVPPSKCIQHLITSLHGHCSHHGPNHQHGSPGSQQPPPNWPLCSYSRPCSIFFTHQQSLLKGKLSPLKSFNLYKSQSTYNGLQVLTWLNHLLLLWCYPLQVFSWLPLLQSCWPSCSFQNTWDSFYFSTFEWMFPQFAMLFSQNMCDSVPPCFQSFPKYHLLTEVF